MKKLILLYIFISALTHSQFQLKKDTLAGNNIRSYFYNSGIFNQNINTSNYKGFEWPAGSNKFAIYTSGLSIAAYINGQFRMAAASFKGEFVPGYSSSGVFYTDSRFRFYKIKRGDSYLTNPDWLNWQQMVSYGAPYVDVNNSGHYEYSIDTPGVRGASQTIFICLTDGNPAEHKVGEGFGGGTLPMYCEIHFTAWCYNNPGFQDMQFIKWDIINKNTFPWNKSYFSILCDPNLGFSGDNYIGSDSTRGLAYSYNADNDDDSVNYWSENGYGVNPPAVGIASLNCLPKTLPVGSIISFYSSSSTPGASCEKEPNGYPGMAYNYMKGYKSDATPWVVPNTNPPLVTKFCYSGDLETVSGWTEYIGKINNCGGSLYGDYIHPSPFYEKDFLISHGSDNKTVNVNDTVRVLVVQLIARGSNNLNSVTMLKQLTDRARQLCQNGFVIGINSISNEVPSKFSLYQNYPNPFNPVTRIKFEIPVGNGRDRSTLKIYDAIGREITTMVNEKLNAGVYSVDWDASNYPSGVYFYQLTSGSYVETKKMVLIK